MTKGTPPPDCIRRGSCSDVSSHPRTSTACFLLKHNGPIHTVIESLVGHKLMWTVDEKFELTYLLGVDDLTGAEVALLGGGGDGEDGHDGGEVHAVDHGWE